MCAQGGCSRVEHWPRGARGGLVPGSYGLVLVRLLSFRGWGFWWWVWIVGGRGRRGCRAHCWVLREQTSHPLLVAGGWVGVCWLWWVLPGP